MATKKCVRLQAHFQHRWDHCGQLREWLDARRLAQNADLSTPACGLYLHRLTCLRHIPHGSSHSHLSSIVIPSMDMRSVPWVFSLHRSLLPALPLLPPFPHGRRWLHDNQHPVQLRKRDLRHPGRLPHHHTCCALQNYEKAKRIVWVVDPTKSKQNLCVSWKPVNLQDCVWENHCRFIMKTILQEKETIHYGIKIGSEIYSYASSHENSSSKSSSGQGMGKIGEKLRRGNWRKSEARKSWSMKQGRRAQKFISPHWWTYVIWKMLNWRQSTKNTKAESYSEVTLWKMILVRTQYSLNKDHQHHKWEQQMSWISSQDCLVAQDKQLTQYLLFPR